MGQAVHVAAEVDCLISLATVARDCNWVRPVLTRDNVLDICQGKRAKPGILHSSKNYNSLKHTPACTENSDKRGILAV